MYAVQSSVEEYALEQSFVELRFRDPEHVADVLGGVDVATRVLEVLVEGDNPHDNSLISVERDEVVVADVVGAVWVEVGLAGVEALVVVVDLEECLHRDVVEGV